MEAVLEQVSQSGRIAVMPPDLSNQIAAGEVVERPASIVKELVENSLDAGATDIRVALEEGGRRLVEVRDDGSGMTAGEAALSLLRHATSKLYHAEDLQQIRTLGFRGEALPSIASVSRLRLTTRPAGELAGTVVEVEAGKLRGVRPGACPVGTEVSVADLFYNTPARLKFLKSEGVERRHVLEWMLRLGLARPAVRLALLADGRSALEAPGTRDLRERAALLLGERAAEALFPLTPLAREGGVRVSGLFGSPKATRRTPGDLYTFVNGRFIRDRRVHSAIQVAYGTLIERGQYPVVVLFVDIPADRVDVNVHPTKIEVRFDQPDEVFRAVRAALLDGLASAPWVPGAAASSRARVYRLHDAPPEADADASGELDSNRVLPAAAEAGPAAGSAGAPTFALRAPEPAAPAPIQQTLSGLGRLVPDVGGTSGGWWTTGALRPDPATPDVPPPRYFSALRYIGRLGEVYLACQDAEGLVVIDQHAAHERITFERLRTQYAAHHREVQPLLLPVTLEMDRIESQILSQSADFFARIGFELEPFAGGTWVLRAVPAVLKGARYERLVREAIEEIRHQGHSERLDEAVDAVLSRMACHGSVRAGDRMAPQAVEALLSQMDEIDFRANCPHGRPVFIRMSWTELERRFERR